MKREQKYPNTNTFTYYNANPKNKFTGDCVVRALCTAMEKPYDVVYKELLDSALKTGYSIASRENYANYLKTNGWVKQPQPRKGDNTKYTGEEFCEMLQTYRKNNRIVANIGGHHTVAIIKGKVHDHWNSTDGCIGNYWVKI